MSLIRLDAIELDDLLKKVGFTDPEARRSAWAVAMRESRGTPEIVGGPNANGSYDWGLFQINDVHRADPSNGIDWSRILDGEYNARLAYDWTDEGTDWSTWGLGDKGWAGALKTSNYETWLKVQEGFKVQYDAYPQALAIALDMRLRPAVSLAALRPGLRNESVRLYQNALRAFLSAAGYSLSVVNPSGATGYYGAQTKTMTKTAYAHLAKATGDPSWLKGDLTTPGPSLVLRIGLRVVK